MALERLYLFIFVIYCTTVGTVLMMMPWSPAWDQLLLHLPLENPQLLQNQWLRGLLSGFGLVHLVWSVHDLNLVLNPTLMADHSLKARPTVNTDAEDPNPSADSGSTAP